MSLARITWRTGHRMALLENAGHYPMEDRPEDIARLIAKLPDVSIWLVRLARERFLFL